MTAYAQHAAPDYQNAYRIEFLRQRAQRLYAEGHESAQQNTTLRTAFDELSTVLDLLQSVEQEHQKERESWLDERARLEADIQTGLELFCYAPLAYLVTSLDGTIRQVNIAATALLQADEKLLIGRALSFFTPDGQRRDVRHSIVELQQHDGVQTLKLIMKPWNGPSFDAELVVAVARSRVGKPQFLRWQIQDVSARKHAERMLHERIAEFETVL